MYPYMSKVVYRKGTWGTETSQYPQEEKVKTILRVVASEIGRAQTRYSNITGVRNTNKVKVRASRTTREGRPKKVRVL